MSVTLYTAPMLTARPPSRRRPHVLAETASMLAVLFANERCTRVLLLTGSEPNFVKNSTIKRKPGAVRVVIEEGEWAAAHCAIEEFCVTVKKPRSRMGRVLPPCRPVVIVNDVDYFIADGGIGGQFTRTGDPALLKRIETLARCVEDAQGELVLMAVLDESAEGRWGEIVEEKRWHWKRHSDLAAGLPRAQRSPKSSGRRAAVAAVPSKRTLPIPLWCHAPDEDRPTTFPFGPLVGTQEQLASWLFGGQ